MRYWLIGCEFYYTLIDGIIRVYNTLDCLIYKFSNIRLNDGTEEFLQLCTRVVHQFIYEQGIRKVKELSES